MSTIQYMQDLYNQHNVLETVTQNPDGVKFGHYGDIIRYNNNGIYSVYTCVSSPQGKSWQPVYIPSASNAVIWGNILGTVTDQIDLVSLVNTANNPNGNIICEAHTPTDTNGWWKTGNGTLYANPDIRFKIVKNSSFNNVTGYFYGKSVGGTLEYRVNIGGVVFDTANNTTTNWYTSATTSVVTLTNGNIYNVEVIVYDAANTNLDNFLWDFVLLGS